MASDRWKIRLEWGGTLFCSQFNVIVFPSKNEEPSLSLSNWTMFSMYLSTSFNMTCEFLKLLRDFSYDSFMLLTYTQIRVVLDGLEITYWHAVSFNEQLSLRMRLKSLGINTTSSVSKFPQLIDQEVLSLSTILRVLLSKYLTTKNSNLLDESSIYISANLERYDVVCSCE